ncbi:probable peptide methionine sulfoxide reductase MsrA [Coccomyxa sp. Obi]|nr:probable peptide methionine sulfoxide reductase MsrA [Coccomyxa sp. Obi]
MPVFSARPFQLSSTSRHKSQLAASNPHRRARNAAIGTTCSLGQRTAMTAAVLSLLASSCSPAAAARPAFARISMDIAEASDQLSSSETSTSSAPMPVYFGNGCFWGRQKEFVDAEKSLGRSPDKISSVVGYAGGREQGPKGLVCYYYGPKSTVYEELGHAEVVQVQLDPDKAQKEMEKFADVYFSQFRKTPFGMLRLDPQDAGPGYRNVIGIPGGIKSPLFKVLQERNVHNMKLVEGEGNAFVDGKPLEDDKFNTVYVVDSEKLPFNLAEKYHQFHNGIGVPFPADYTRNLKRAVEVAGRIRDTGCPEYPF